MSIEEENNLRQAILSTIELHGMEEAEKRYLDIHPAGSRERRRIQSVFAQLEQDQAGNWSFRAA